VGQIEEEIRTSLLIEVSMPQRIARNKRNFQPTRWVGYRHLFQKIQERRQASNRQTVFTGYRTALSPFANGLDTHTHKPGNVTPAETATG